MQLLGVTVSACRQHVLWAAGICSDYTDCLFSALKYPPAMCLMILSLKSCLCSEPNKPRTLVDCTAWVQAYEMVHIYRDAEIGTWP
jgi:hypothetical protein